MKKYLYLLLLVFTFSACQEDGPQKNYIAGEALGTTYHITFFAEEDVDISTDLDSIFNRVNHSMSTYMPDSDISRINRGDSLVKVDSLFSEVFELSQKVYKESDGYFDPTVGDLVNLYGFGPENITLEVDSATVDSMMNFVGLDKIRITPEGFVEKEFPQIYLDFNAIAKGYTVDLIGNLLDARGVDNYLIELGGELLAQGKNLKKDAFWTVGIDDPNQPEGKRTLTAIIQLKNKAMATSGNYRKFRIDPETGAKIVHTINPLTGYPKPSNLLSATVLAETCALADAYATTFMAMGLEKSKEFLSRHDEIDAFLIFSEGSETKKSATPGFKEVMKK